MRSDGDEKVADVLVEILTDLMPRTNFLTLIPKACVTRARTTASCSATRSDARGGSWA